MHDVVVALLFFSVGNVILFRVVLGELLSLAEGPLFYLLRGWSRAMCS